MTAFAMARPASLSRRCFSATRRLSHLLVVVVLDHDTFLTALAASVELFVGNIVGGVVGGGCRRMARRELVAGICRGHEQKAERGESHAQNVPNPVVDCM